VATFVKDRLAELVHGIRYRDLPPEVVAAGKRVILDTLACAAGALRSEPAAIVKSVARGLGGNAEATTIGDGGRTSCALATLVNGTLIRYLDNNDYYFGFDSAHPSGNLAPALAVAEKCGRTGADVIVALVAGVRNSTAPVRRRRGIRHFRARLASRAPICSSRARHSRRAS
jgi:2-methylcitrate dehydratase